MACKLRPVILLISYTKYAVEKVIVQLRVSLPSTRSEPACFSSINLGSSLISHRDAMPPHLAESLNREAWVKAILSMPCSLNSCSKLGLQQVRSWVVINQPCPVYIRGQWLKPNDDMLHYNSKFFLQWCPQSASAGSCAPLLWILTPAGEGQRVPVDCWWWASRGSGAEL